MYPRGENKHGALRGIAAFICWLAVACAPLSGNAENPKLMEVQLVQTRMVGMPVHWGEREAILLEPSGQLLPFELSELASHQVLSSEFVPQSLSDARVQLQLELGPAYDTSITGPYIIAAPVGQTQRWHERFTALLAGYVRYFKVRGWPLRRPDFPLRVIICGSRQEFMQHAQGATRQLPENVVGSYFPKSNRCVLYQITGSAGTNWAETEATIVHEAVHQLAYNTGIHERLAQNPLWFVEGLASMFEQSAVYDSRVASSSLQSRMIPDKVARLRVNAQDIAQLQQHLASLISDDRLFRTDAILAYDLSWALTFYLAERRPQEYRQYYELLSARPFGGYPETQRANDFRAAFGGNLGSLAVQLQQLIVE